MNMERVEEIEKRYNAIQNERTYGKGYRYDRQERADQMVIDFEGAGYIDQLIQTIKQQAEQIKQLTRFPNHGWEEERYAYQEQIKQYEEVIGAIANIDASFINGCGEVEGYTEGEEIKRIHDIVTPLWNKIARAALDQ